MYALVDSVENYEKVGNALYEGLQARKAEIFYVDPDNYISVYNGSKAFGITTFDVCTIACTLGGGTVVKGTQLAKVAIDVSKTANKVAEVNKLVEVIKTTNNARILAKFTDWLRQGLTNTVVYIGYDVNGVAKYVGITNDIVRRQAEHATKGITLRKIVPNALTKNQARTIEQNIINTNKALESDDWLNLINSISKERDIYQSALEWGDNYMKSNNIPSIWK